MTAQGFSGPSRALIYVVQNVIAKSIPKNPELFSIFFIKLQPLSTILLRRDSINVTIMPGRLLHTSGHTSTALRAKNFTRDTTVLSADVLYRNAHASVSRGTAPIAIVIILQIFNSLSSQNQW